jgi:hypothetical protein
VISEQLESGPNLRSSAILVLGFSRPEFIIKRLTELQGISEVQVVVSVDKSNNFYGNLDESWMRAKELFPNVIWWFRSSHLGIAQNLFYSVTEVFKVHDNCIVIEDDVSINQDSIGSILQVLDARLPKEVLTVGLFGGLPSSRITNSAIKNRWRRTRYFSAWGWAIQREDWSLFSLYIAHYLRNTVDDLVKLRLGPRKLNIWSRRIGTVVDNPLRTWDYQIFFYSLLLNKQHLLPIFRACENEGFNDYRATNTKERRPFWYRGKSGSQGSIEQPILGNSILSAGLQFVDSLTWVSDSRILQKIIRIKGRFFD